MQDPLANPSFVFQLDEIDDCLAFSACGQEHSLVMLLLACRFLAERWKVAHA